jgi:ABC-type multidrug transport system fused ATPase/permease subunit
MRLEHGEDTELAEAGSSLSGGERQRLSIARAFLKKAPILVLDGRAERSLDAASEADRPGNRRAPPRMHDLRRRPSAVD